MTDVPEQRAHISEPPRDRRAVVYAVAVLVTKYKRPLEIVNRHLLARIGEPPVTPEELAEMAEHDR